ncbi:MAG: LysM peptidoglycan-binding domain-containing protein, partial [Bacteroidales bacterium]|nr:LysM peptidoglycan-binding domain-containing protein [Bacteroidales bacterium]
DALIAANPILKDGLKIGQKIIIPNEKMVVTSLATTPEIKIEETDIHIVKAGETMYSIAKTHRVRLDSLQLANPKIIDHHIAIGDTLIIPDYVNKNSFIEHKTTEKEKISEIAFNYQTPVQEIKNVNPNYSNTVGSGKIVKIPVAPFQEKDTTSVATQESIPHDTLPTTSTSPQDLTSSISSCIGGWNTESIFKIALMMPFNTNEITTLPEKNQSIKTAIEDFPIFNFFQFYQSTLLALETLKDKGLHIELYVYDITDNSSSIDQLLQNETLPQMDLIVGLLYKDPFFKVADFARNHNISLINVNSVRDELVQGYPNVIKMMPQRSNFAVSVVSVLPDTAQTFNLMIVQKKDSIFSIIDQEIKNEYFKKYSLTIYDSTIYSNYNVTKKLKTDRPNYIIALNNNTASIMDLLRILDKQKNDHEIRIIGYPNWDNIPTLDDNHLQHLNTIFSSPYFIDYKDEHVLHFIRSFREKYNAEPNRWAFQGYDIISYFVEGLAKFGKDFMNCSEHIDYQPMSNDFDFKNQPNDGFINQHWNIYTIENFEPKKLH